MGLSWRDFKSFPEFPKLRYIPGGIFWVKNFEAFFRCEHLCVFFAYARSFYLDESYMTSYVRPYYLHKFLGVSELTWTRTMDQMLGH